MMELESTVVMEIDDCVTVEIDHDHMYTSSKFVEKTVTPKAAPLATEVEKAEVEDEDDEELKLHSCELCGKSYQHSFSLKRHMVVRHCDERPFACEHCGKTFKLNGSLVQHMRFHTGQRRGYECSFCGKHFVASQPWKQHELTHALNWAKNECATCGSRFPTKQALKKHKEVGKCQALPYTCCQKTFVKKRDYLLHRIQSHPEQRVKEHRCEVCDQRFLFAYMLAQHRKSHGPVVSTGAPRPGPRKGPGGPRGSEVKCSICQSVFPSLKELVVHSRTHEDEKPFVCRECGKGLTTKCALERHQRIHTNERPFCCSFCGKGFSGAESVRAHERVHTGERPFGCKYCDKKFARYGNLQSHILTHTGEKPYVCTVCGRGFAQTSTLKGHLKTHGIGEGSRRKKPAKKAVSSDESETGTSAVEDRAREVRRLLLGTQEIRKAQERGVGRSNEVFSAIAGIPRASRNTFQTVDGQQYEIDENVVLVLQ